MPIPCRSIATCASSPRGRSPDEEARVPHRLYGHVDAAVNYSVGRWCRDVAEALAETRSARPPADPGRRHRALFQGADQGLAAVPPIPADIRDAVRARLGARALARASCRALPLDPATAQRLMPNDRSRISRALEVVLATGRSLSDWHREGMPALIDASACSKVFLTCEREELVRADRGAFCRHAGGRRARRGEGACRAQARSGCRP